MGQKMNPPVNCFREEKFNSISTPWLTGYSQSIITVNHRFSNLNA